MKIRPESHVGEPMDSYNGLVHIRRTTSWPDRLRSYQVVVDGDRVAVLHPGGVIEFPISPGHHTIVIRIDWCSSNTLEFEVMPGERVIFECGSNLTGWRMVLALFYILFVRHEYLYLRFVGRRPTVYPPMIGPHVNQEGLHPNYYEYPRDMNRE